MTTPGLPPLFGAPWERRWQLSGGRDAEGRIRYDAGEDSLAALRRDIADAIRKLNPPEYERRSSGYEWVGAVPLPEFVDLVIIRMLDKLESWRPATEYQLKRLRT